MIVGRFPHRTASQWQAKVHLHILPVEIGPPIAAVVWLAQAWANRWRVWLGRLVDRRPRLGRRRGFPELSSGADSVEVLASEGQL